MKSTVPVDLGDRSYGVECEYAIFASLGERIAGLFAGKNVAVISDSNVAPLYLERLSQQLSAEQRVVSEHVVAAGEASKSMENVATLCSQMAAAGHDRKSLVVALGGGVVGDLAGFVASVFYRGVPFVQIPTTIVSQVDSSVGGKTGVNIPEGKNLVGAFHQPLAVWIDPEVLQSLPSREYREGYAEVIKHAAIRDAEMFDVLEGMDPQNQAPPASLLARNVAIKARVVEEDEQETSGVRALLNFGHTIGHGIEASVPYGELLHGEAVSLGIRAALFLSERCAGLEKPQSQRVLGVLKQFGLPLVLDESIDTERILEKTARDKKFSAGSIQFVLLRALGEAFVSREVTAERMREAIEHLREPV